MRGQILSYSLQSNTGIVLGSDDKRYTFTNLDWKSAGMPELGMEVDFVCAGEAANQLYSLNFPKKSGDIEKSDEDGVIYQKAGNFFSWFLLAFKNYAKFRGRSTRQEFWMFYLVNTIIILILPAIVDGFFETGNELLRIIFTVIVFIPFSALSCRRLHDIGRSGWWLVSPIGSVFFVFAMIIWFFASDDFISISILSIAIFMHPLLVTKFLVWYCTKGNVGENKYGDEIRWK